MSSSLRRSFEDLRRADVVVGDLDDRLPAQLDRVLDDVEVRLGAAVVDDVEQVVLSEPLRGLVLVGYVVSPTVRGRPLR